MARPAGIRKPSPLPCRPKDLTRINGLSAVLALFAARPDQVERLFFDPRHADSLKEACQHMAARRKPYRQVLPDELTKIASTPLHGGVVAHAHPLPIPAFDPRSPDIANTPLLILDGVGNPHNLGAIIRSMAFFGLPRLIVSDHPLQALPSDAAFRIAEGGMEWVTLSRVTALADSLRILRKTHKVIGTFLGDHPSLFTHMAENQRPLALVLGNEEQGLRAEIAKACEFLATIKGCGQVQSLNVAATAAILTHMLSCSQEQSFAPAQTIAGPSPKQRSI